MKKRLFIDMDGTVARFHDEINYLERMFEKGFFENLEPFQKAIFGLNLFHRVYPDVELYIISSTVDGYPPYCEDEKNRWLDKWMKFIDKEHRLFPKIGQNKADVVPGGITENDYLYDDYNKNLEEWVQAGGSSIKCHNNINHKGRVGERWTGTVILNYDPTSVLLSDDVDWKEEVLNEYNDIMLPIEAQRTIGQPYSIGTSEWNLRDMFSELSHWLPSYYEEGHSNYRMQYSKHKGDREEWERQTELIKGFISKYDINIYGLICTTNHCSEYDNAEEGYAEFVNQLAYSMGIGRDPSIDDYFEDEDAEM